MYNVLAYHLDLCIMSYSLYTQSICWPMDPYYEQMSRSNTSRRDNFLAQVRTRLKEPYMKGNNKSCRDDIDPLYCSYNKMNPTIPCIARNEPGEWIVYSPLHYIVDNIRMGYTKLLDNEPSIPNEEEFNKKGTDELYCFEGITGDYADKVGQKSIMGFVLNRTDNDVYDLHIIFRGSRSGKAARSYILGQQNKGNADWVTDLNYMYKTETKVSVKGRCMKGFSESIVKMLPSVMLILEEINKKRKKPPRYIYVSGHSLGGALAAYFAAAMVIGDRSWVNNKLSEVWKWPWNALQLITLSCPVVGDKVFQDYFENNIYCRRVKVNLDPVTSDGWIPHHPLTKWNHVGKLIEFVEETKDFMGPNHDFYTVRIAMIKWLTNTKLDLNNVPFIGANDTGPVKKYKNLSEVLKDPNFNDDLGRLHTALCSGNSAGLAGILKDRIVLYLEILHTVLLDPTSYPTGFGPDSNAVKGKGEILINIAASLSTGSATEPDWVKCKSLFTDNTYLFLRLCYFIGRLSFDNKFALADELKNA